MTCGIYILTFTNMIFYIGKSVDCETRYEQHKEDMVYGRAAKKVQEAYRQYGEPDMHVIQEAHCDHIDLLEAFYIQTWKPCLNTTIPYRLSDKEIKILKEEKHWLKKSTVEHLEMINRQLDKLAKYKDTEQGKLIELNVTQGKMLADIMTELNKLKKRSLWQRIINSN